MRPRIFYPSRMDGNQKAFAKRTQWPSRLLDLAPLPEQDYGLPFAYAGPRFGTAWAERPALMPTCGAYEHSVVHYPCHDHGSCGSALCATVTSLLQKSRCSLYSNGRDKKTSPIMTYDELLF